MIKFFLYKLTQFKFDLNNNKKIHILTKCRLFIEKSVEPCLTMGVVIAS